MLNITIFLIYAKMLYVVRSYDQVLDRHTLAPVDIGQPAHLIFVLLSTVRICKVLAKY